MAAMAAGVPSSASSHVAQACNAAWLVQVAHEHSLPPGSAMQPVRRYLSSTVAGSHVNLCSFGATPIVTISGTQRAAQPTASFVGQRASLPTAQVPLQAIPSWQQAGSCVQSQLPQLQQQQQQLQSPQCLYPSTQHPRGQVVMPAGNAPSSSPSVPSVMQTGQSGNSASGVGVARIGPGMPTPTTPIVTPRVASLHQASPASQVSAQQHQQPAMAIVAAANWSAAPVGHTLHSQCMGNANAISRTIR